MGSALGRLLSQFQDLVADMPASRRAAVLIFLGLIISSMIALMMWARQPDFQVLYSGLSQPDSASVVARLRDKRVPFKLEAGGAAILVPAGEVHEARLALAEEGIPSGGGVGFEIFDRSTLGVTDFVQRVNYQRALQGELARTIGQIRGVESARVHIVMPDRSLFAEQQRKPSASVVMKLAGGAVLPPNQVKAVVHLVASSVEGLDSRNVTVVDARGNILAGGRPEAEEQFLTASQMEFKAQMERRLEDRVESMLVKVVGPGRAVARVDVELNMRRVERTRELFDPEKQVVRSERRSKESSESGQAGAGGVPGVQSNVPASEQAAAGRLQQAGQLSQQKNTRVNETVNYEIDKTVERVVEPMGDLRRVSVAVMVDGTYTQPAGGGQPQFQPRGQAEIANFTQLVSAAIGFNQQRGDTIRVMSVPFQVPSAEAGEGATAQQAFVLTLAKYVMGVVALALIFLFVIRPLLAWVAALELRARPGREGLAAGPEGMLPAGVMAQLQAAAPEAVKTAQQLEIEEARVIYEEVYNFVSESPDRTADLLRGWIKERPG
ncbi:MAG: flagellar basal-body MS-ring/collar protein FliF [Nitrospinota bacterium]